MPFSIRPYRRFPVQCAVTRTTQRIWDSGILVLTYMECFSSATNLFGFLRLSEILVE
jgi:hypothetical protein